MEYLYKTEVHTVRPGHPLHAQVDELCFRSKNLYNASLYEIRQHFFRTGELKSAADVERSFTGKHAGWANPDYGALQSHIAGETVSRAAESFVTFFKGLKAKREGVVATPRIPGYLPSNGRAVASAPKSAVAKSRPEVSDGLFELTVAKKSLGLRLRTRVRPDKVQEVRFVPKGSHYQVEVVYREPAVDLVPDNGRYAGVDLGVDVLAAVVFNTGDRPLLFSGRHVKSINQFYSKERAKHAALLARDGDAEGGETSTSRKLKKLALKRGNKLNHELHAVSAELVNQVVSRGVCRVIVGHNPGWKQETSLGCVGNQKFGMMPYSKFVKLLGHKLAQRGIELVLTEESYTSKASFLDADPLPVYGSRSDVCRFSGYRESRGLFKRRGVKQRVHADVNGAGNVLRKVVPDEKVFFDGIEGVVVRPVMFRGELFRS